MRIRPFNTRDTYPEQNLDNDLCQAVVAGGVVYLRGQIGQDLDTGNRSASATSRPRPRRRWQHRDAPRRGRQLAAGHRQGHRVSHRHPLPRTGLPVMGRWLKGVTRFPRFGRRGACASRVAGRDRRHRSHLRRNGTADDVLLSSREIRPGRLRHRDLFVEPCGRLALCTHYAPTSASSRHRTSPIRRSGHSRSTRSPAASDAKGALEAALAQNSSPTIDS